MGKSGSDKGKQEILDFQCKKIISGVEKLTSSPHVPLKKSTTIGTDSLVSQIMSSTPEKIDRRVLYAKYKDERSIDIPEKYKLVIEMFNRMICSLRLLNLSKKSPTFQNVSTQVEVLTNRKFTYNHLAQMKYIFPEAVQIEKILVHDEKSLCMKPDMKITLLLYLVVESHQEKSSFLALCQLFTKKISNFIDTHPEGSDIPEAVLPMPYNQRNQSIVPEAFPEDNLLQSQRSFENMNGLYHPLKSSFISHFSSKIPLEETESSQLSAVSPVHIAHRKTDILTGQSIQSKQKTDSVKFFPLVNVDLMVETPVQKTPKRSSVINNNLKIEKGTLLLLLSGDESTTTTTTKRYLDFSDKESDEFVKAGNRNWPNEIVTEKVDDKNGNEMNRMAELVSLIGDIFESSSWSSITKEELVYKIITSDSIIIMEKRGEIVEEEIENLEKKVPEWIRRTVSCSGDVVYIIKKEMDLDTVIISLARPA